MYKTKDLIGPLQNESNKQEPLLVEVMTKLLFCSERQRMGENTGGKNILLLIQIDPSIVQSEVVCMMYSCKTKF